MARGKLLDELGLREALYASSSAEEAAPGAHSPANRSRRVKATPSEPAAQAQRDPANTFRREHFFFGDTVSAVRLADEPSPAPQPSAESAAAVLPRPGPSARKGRRDVVAEGATPSPSVIVLHRMVTEAASPPSPGPSPNTMHEVAGPLAGSGVRKAQGAECGPASISNAASGSTQSSTGGQAASRQSHAASSAVLSSTRLGSEANLNPPEGIGGQEVREQPGETTAGRMQRLPAAQDAPAQAQTTRGRRSRRDQLDTAFAAALAGVRLAHFVLLIIKARVCVCVCVCVCVSQWLNSLMEVSAA